ncbi:MAG: TetR/AcrR family transcriptional regulator [Pseudodesulfovibrio sp.]|uniref:TetR/AcrR family transcriptional regulator n=1 Tax=Pseudodesulfovibrio sp. TaxID=2035812 RepID=UPI003D0DA67E
MNNALDLEKSTRERILSESIHVFGRLGYRKSSMESLAAAAGLSKQGLYLHFAGKHELFQASLRYYLDQGLGMVRAHLARPVQPLSARLLCAMEAWFGRHKDTFAGGALDVAVVGLRIANEDGEEYQDVFRREIARAIAAAGKEAAGSASDIAQVLFVCGLSWKEPGLSREEFMARMALCIKVCLGEEKRK